MKRFLLVLFAGLLLNIHVFAQYDDDDDYDYNYGSDDYSSEESKTDVSGPSIVTNDGTQGYSEQKLTLPNNQPIYLYFYNTVQNPNPPEPQNPPAQTVQPSAPPPYEPEPIIEYRYVPSPVAPPPPPPPEPIYFPPPQIEYIYIQPPAPQIEYIYLQPPPPQVEYLPPPMVEPIQPPQVEPVFQQYIPPPMQIRVIPGLPNPDSNKIYRLQVGSYSVQNTANKMAQRIRSAGLQANVETYNSLKRVIVPGVRAADACSIVQLLESIGFQEVWIRE